MAKAWLETSQTSEVSACNAAPYGYPSPGTPLAGGVVSQEVGGVGWTTGQFPVEAGDPSGFVVEVESSKVPAPLQGKLKATKPKVKPNEKTL